MEAVGALTPPQTTLFVAAAEGEDGLVSAKLGLESLRTREQAVVSLILAAAAGVFGSGLPLVLPKNPCGCGVGGFIIICEPESKLLLLMFLKRKIRRGRKMARRTKRRAPARRVRSGKKPTRKFAQKVKSVIKNTLEL